MRPSTTSLALLATATTTASAATNTTCATGLHMIVARGSTEAPGQGVTSKLTGEVAARVKGSNSVGIVYPATLENYMSSEEQGITAMMKAVTSYHAQCPDGLIALLGYSQGAQVCADTVCGSSEGPNFGNNSALPMELVKDYIVATVIFGDPTHVAKAPYEHGTSTKAGLFPRRNLTDCDAYANQLISYCDTGDVYCDSGSVAAVHHSYINKYGDQMVDYIVGKYKNATSKSSSNSTSNSNSTSTSSGSKPTGTSTSGSGGSGGGGASMTTGSGAPAKTTAATKGAAAGLMAPGVVAMGLLGGFVLLL